MDNKGNIIVAAIITAMIILTSIFGYAIIIITYAYGPCDKYFDSELNAVEAEIHSPAIIRPVKTLTEFKQLQKQYNATIYSDGAAFYLVPDTYIGYSWKPEYPSWSIPSPENITNR